MSSDSLHSKHLDQEDLRQTLVWYLAHSSFFASVQCYPITSTNFEINLVYLERFTLPG